MLEETIDEFIESEYMEMRGLERTDAVRKFSEEFKITYSTVYRWIKDDSIKVISCNGISRPVKLLTQVD